MCRLGISITIPLSRQGLIRRTLELRATLQGDHPSSGGTPNREAMILTILRLKEGISIDDKEAISSSISTAAMEHHHIEAQAPATTGDRSVRVRGRGARANTDSLSRLRPSGSAQIVPSSVSSVSLRTLPTSSTSSSADIVSRRPVPLPLPQSSAGSVQHMLPSLPTHGQARVRSVTKEQFEHASSVISSSVSVKTKNSVYANYVENWSEFTFRTWGYNGCPALTNSGLDIMTKIIYVILWMEHLKLSGLDIDKGIPALKYEFTEKLQDGSPIFDSDFVTRAKTSLRKQGGQGAREKQTKHAQEYRSPMVIEMVEFLRSEKWSSPEASLDSKMTYLAIAMAFNFGLRSEEVCHAGPGEDFCALHVDDCVFEDASATRYPFSSIGSLSQTQRDSITTFRGVIRYDKSRAISEAHGANPKKWGGRPPRQLFLGIDSSDAERQLLLDLVEWACISGTKPGDLVCSRTQTGGRGIHSNKKLLRKDVAQAQKLAGDHFGLPVDMFSTHSNRISAGTILKAAGHSSESIRQYGGWHSDAVFRYERSSSRDLSALRDAEQSRRDGNPALSVTDLKSMVPIGYNNKTWYYGIHYGKRHAKHGKSFVTSDYAVAYRETNEVPSADYKRFDTQQEAESYAQSGMSASSRKRQKTSAI